MDQFYGKRVRLYMVRLRLSELYRRCVHIHIIRLEEESQESIIEKVRQIN